MANKIKPTGVGVPEPTPAPVDPTPEAAPEAFDFEKWTGAQPKEALEQYQAAVLSSIDKSLRDKFGDVYEFFINDIPNDQELYQDFKAYIPRLKDKEARKWIESEAFTSWDKYTEAKTQADRLFESNNPVPPELTRKIDELESKLSRREQAEIDKQHADARAVEFAALYQEFPDIQYHRDATGAATDTKETAYRLAEKIVNEAESRRLPLRKVYEEYAELMGRRENAPQSAPMVSPPGPPTASKQAPRTKAESQQRMLNELAKAGGWNNFVKAQTKK